MNIKFTNPTNPIISTKYFALVSLFFLIFTACERDLPQAVESVSDEFCLENDCVTKKNDNVVYTGDVTKNSANLSVVKKKFRRFWNNSQPGNTRNDYGKPAWDLLTTHELSESEISYYYLPMIHEHSDRVEAVVLITLLKNSYTFRFNLLKREELSALPLDLETEQIPRDYFETKINAIAATTFFLEADNEIFGFQDQELLSQLPPKARTAFLGNKDVICTIHTYIVTSCQTTLGGQNNEYYIDTDCNSSIETVTGCTGGTTGGVTGGSTSGGSGPSGPSGGTGVTVTVVTDRCIEDGVGCEDEFPDCESWVYVPTSNPGTQACGISNLEFYYIAYIPQVRFVAYQFNRNIYFEFPTSRLGQITPGRAASLTADAVEEATDRLRDLYGSDVPSGPVFESQFMEFLDEEMGVYGGSARFDNYYNTTSVNGYQSNLLGVNNNCN